MDQNIRFQELFKSYRPEENNLTSVFKMLMEDTEITGSAHGEVEELFGRTDRIFGMTGSKNDVRLHTKKIVSARLFYPVDYGQNRHLLLIPSITGTTVFKYGHMVRREMIDLYMLLYVRTGKGVLEYGGESYQLEPGDAFMIYTGNAHRYYCTDPDGWSYDYLYFNGAAASAYFEVLRENCVIHIPEDSGFCKYIDELQQFETQEAINVSGDFLPKDFYCPLSAQGVYEANRLISDLLSEVMKAYSLFKKQKQPGWLQDVLHSLDIRFKEKISLEQLAEESFVSKYHLAREFKKQTGHTVMEYVINARITEAKKLLVFSDLSVSDVAQECGFSSEPYFIRTFKKHSSLTPLQFRKTRGWL